MTRRITNLLATGRKISDGRGNVTLYLPHACDHYEEIPLFEASEELRNLVWLASGADDVPPENIEDTPALREAIRTFVGYGLDEEQHAWVAVCYHNRCYPCSWPDQQVRSCEAFVHEVVNQGDITSTTVPGPRAYCQKVCYQTTPHFYDIEVWDQAEDRPAFRGKFSGQEHPASPAGRKYQIVLRCENCHHGYNFVTKNSSPSRWRRLMKNETARTLLKGASPNWEPAF
jgi:hypothetical protein